MEKLSIENINKGAMPELFDLEVEKILKDIADPNKPAKATRCLVFKIEFIPQNEKRREFVTTLSSEIKLPKREKHTHYATAVLEGSGLKVYTESVNQEDLFDEEEPNITPISKGER